MKHVVVIALLFTVAGCKKPVCEPGETQECVCAGALAGAQVCNPQGSGWGECRCTEPLPASPEPEPRTGEPDAAPEPLPTSPEPEPRTGEPDAAPEPQADPPDSGAKVISAPGLPKEVIGRVVKHHAGDIQECYGHELEIQPALEGKVVVNFTISAEGKVSEARVQSTTLGDAEVESCIVDEVKTWTFPEPSDGGIVQVSYPFIFKREP